MSFNLGDALIAGLGGAADTLNDAMTEKRKADLAEQEREQEMMAQEAYTKRMKSWDLSVEPPDIKTYDTSVDGRPGKQTMSYSFDPVAGKQVATDLGFMPNKPATPFIKDVINGSNIQTERFNPDTGAMELIGTPGPRWNPRPESAGSGDKISFSDYQSMAPEQQAAYRAYKAPGSQGESESDKADMKARADTAMQLRDFGKLDRYDKLQVLRSQGIDPFPINADALQKYRGTLPASQLADFDKLDKVGKVGALKSAGLDPGVPKDDDDVATPLSSDVLQKYRNTLRDDNLTLMGVNLFNNRGPKVAGGVSSTAPVAQQPSPLLSSSSAVAGNSPTQPSAPSMAELMKQASAAVNRGADRNQVEARLQQLMQQYGYRPNDQQNVAQNDSLQNFPGDALLSSGGSQKTNSPYPDGTRLKGQDGRMYVVQNGQPVPAN